MVEDIAIIGASAQTLTDFRWPLTFTAAVFRSEFSSASERQRLEFLQKRLQASLGVERERDNHLIDPTSWPIVTRAQYPDTRDCLRDSRFPVVTNAVNGNALVL